MRLLSWRLVATRTRLVAAPVSASSVYPWLCLQTCTLCHPVLSTEGQAVAVLELYRRDKPFSEEDVQV